MEDSKKKLTEKFIVKENFIGAIFIAIALIVSAYFVSEAISTLREGRTISVKGYAEMDIVSDVVSWSISLTENSTTLESGYDKIKSQAERIFQYLQHNGISKDSIEIGNLGNDETYEYLPNGCSRKTGFRFYQNFTIQSKNLNKIKELSNQITELIREGISINSWAPQYSYTKLNDLKINMLGAATQDAKIRAEQIAKSGGNKIGGIVSANQGVFQITSPNSNEVNDYGINDLSSINKTIKSVVTVKYSIK